MKTVLWSVTVGTAITLALFGLGWLASDQGAERLSYLLYWQSYVMYQMLPCTVSDLTPGEFLCESLTAARFTFFGGLPVGILIYSTAAYLVLRWLRRPRAGS